MPFVCRVSFTSDYKSLLLYNAFHGGRKIFPNPAIVSPDWGSEEPCAACTIVRAVSLRLFPMPYVSTDFLCCPRTLVPLKGLLTSGFTCEHALRIARGKGRLS